MGGMLAGARLVTLTGAGGIGKTRLALQAAAGLLADYPDGVWLVELAPLSDPALVPQAVATALGVRETPGEPLLASLIAALQAKQLLLLLDNCEHLVAACAALADALLRVCPQLAILATSREALGIAGERAWRVPGLTQPAVHTGLTPDQLLESVLARGDLLAGAFRRVPSSSRVCWPRSTATAAPRCRSWRRPTLTSTTRGIGGAPPIRSTYWVGNPSPWATMSGPPLGLRK